MTHVGVPSLPGLLFKQSDVKVSQNSFQEKGSFGEMEENTNWHYETVCLSSISITQGVTC